MHVEHTEAQSESLKKHLLQKNLDVISLRILTAPLYPLVDSQVNAAGLYAGYNCAI